MSTNERTALLMKALLLVLMVLLYSGAQAQLSNDSCYKCHGEKWIATTRPEALSAMVRVAEGETRVLRAVDDVDPLFTPRDEFAKSVHGGMQCIECHRGVERLPHNQRLAALNCADCHSDVKDALARGPHGETDENGKKRPSCTDCHGDAHSIEAVVKPRSYAQAVDMVRACEKCHNADSGHGFNPVESYEDNIHGTALFKNGLAVTATCADCHGTHEMLPPTDPESPLHPVNVAETCGKCHEGIEAQYEGSIHGQLLEDAYTADGKVIPVVEGTDPHKAPATCTNCHHSHGIQKVSEPFLLEVVNECSHCHAELAESYMLSYHGKAAHLGYAEVAVCSSCHGAHDILPPDHPESRVAEGNLVKTCGECHENANENFVQYIAHVDYLDRKKNPEVFWTFVFMTTLLLGTLAVFIPHTILWFQRTLVARLKHPRGHMGHKKKERMIERFSIVHRITHGLIVVSFMGLVATGFPLKYSHTDWAAGATALFGGIKVMGILHRGFALITFAYVAVHAAFLVHFFWKKCPRPRWRYVIGPNSMLFSLQDLKDVIAMVRWFLWIGPRPKLDRWAYFEKFDYWGEIWGVFIIGGSGLLLWMFEEFIRLLPGWVLNCAMVMHSIEALLAASVIFLVHFFNTHLRPEKFPIDMVMFTGQMPESEMIEERGREYERLKTEGKLDERVVEPVAFHWRVVGVVLGLTAFMTGIFLIALAIKTEFGQFFG